VKQRILRESIGLAVFVFLTASITNPAMALNIEFNFSGTSPIQEAALGEAAQIWENIYMDDIVLYIDVAFSSMASNIIGATSSEFWYANFEDVRNQLNMDQTTAADAAAVSYIDTLPTIDPGDGRGRLLFNSYNPSSGSDAALYSDPWDIFGTQANLKAIGYTGFTGSDAGIEFNTDFSFDYDRSDSIDSNKMDFIGVASHEIGHVMGFVSAVDTNIWSYNVEGVEILWPPSIIDLYRHTDSYGANEIDISYDGRNGWFSHNGGTTTVDMSDGLLANYQASHWADNLRLGIMDPTASFGELLNVTNNDILAFDVVGYDPISESVPVPEPGTLMFFGSGLVGLLGFRKRFRK
jgi:hypothetical protein